MSFQAVCDMLSIAHFGHLYMHTYTSFLLATFAAFDLQLINAGTEHQ